MIYNSIKIIFASCLLSAILAQTSFAKEIVTNEFVIHNAPDWLKQTRVEKDTDHIQNKLEWSTRKISVNFYSTEAEYEKAQHLGPMALAVTKSSDGKTTMFLGPRVTDANFDEVFSHELVHVISFQKYKGSIPAWLEEGLANHLASQKQIDYKVFATHPLPDDVRHLGHPFKGSADSIAYSYKASQAFAEMLEKKCGLENLIRLSVERKMEDYMNTYCEIKDLNAAFKDWVKKKSN